MEGVRRRAITVGAVAIAASSLAGLAIAAPVIDRDGKPRPFVVVTSGHSSELLKTFEIKRSAKKSRRVAFTIGPHKLPDPSGGGIIEANGEVTLTTTCVDSSERCIGRPYGYSPRLGMQLLLTGKKGATGGRRTIPISRHVSRTCSQHRPNRNHHCPLVIESSKLRVGKVTDLPCKPSRCRINMVVEASDGKASNGNVIVVGADRPDGRIDQGKGRLNAAVFAKGADRGKARRGSSPVNDRIPMSAEGAGGSRVIFSVKVNHLERGDALLARARQLTDIGHLPYSAFVSNQLIVATQRTATVPHGLARKAISYRGTLSAANGFNCTQGSSALPDTMPEPQGQASARVQRDIVSKKGKPKPLFVNLVSRSFPKLASAGARPSAIVRGGYVEVRRLKR